tara:strand:- start:3295 stop:3435 length:141 start_codon:yes stop_codon:yes gene_type:complete
MFWEPFLGNQIDRTTCRVSTIKGTLRATQHLDTLKPGKIKQRALRG